MRKFYNGSISILFILSFTVFSVIAHAQEIQFEQHVVTSTFTDGFDVSTADVDQDGHPDILGCGKVNGGEVCWWRNNGMTEN